MKACFIGVLVVATVTASQASATEESGSSADSWQGTARVEALEVSVGSGYSQGFGDVAAHDEDLSEGASSGSAFAIGVGYRATPAWFVGAYTEGAFFRPDDGSFVRHQTYSAATGVQAHYHLRPFARIDPWLSIGAGARGYWIDSDVVGNSSMLGIDVFRLHAGVGYQMSSSWAMSPVVGASLTEFLVKSEAGSEGFQSIREPRPTTLLFAGIVNRFDFGGRDVRMQTPSAGR